MEIIRSSSYQELEPQISIENYSLPEVSDWRDIDEVPLELRRIVELTMMAGADGEYIDEVGLIEATLDDVRNQCDDWIDDQIVLTARHDGEIAGMLSYYYLDDDTAFFESVAVDPELREQGIGALLIDTALEQIASDGNATKALMMAQSRVADIYERRWGAVPIATSSRTDLVKMSIPINR